MLSALRGRVALRAADAMRALNARHPWSHNDAFHPWVAARLPAGRSEALEVGCGRGELLAMLGEHFAVAHGIDVDREMRRVSAARCAGLPNVTVDDVPLECVPEGKDLVTMIAVLHHFELEPALAQVRRILKPGGRFLCVGLARPDSVIDHLWDAASAITNPIIGFVRHPWVAQPASASPPFPVKDPEYALAQIRDALRRTMPGAVIRRQLGFRHTIEWTKPPRFVSLRSLNDRPAQTLKRNSTGLPHR
ncbi:class I SAM-dependent methyltransferase [Microbacterium azadirachtae]|uniref:class I SAM-dependent methyltransferase n=1 Tax=Microbacterium azadirachtae TaxID=582680 RepID=UPI003F74F770